ncbi:DUF1707 SHOCT-like domain-containing protein [Nakamurella sp.]|uniref:DUF1707 SHOCT-like domain-containing protein n=1 Tax=Nakamurella sp. TaxID=1869182 RepID=UPI003B3AEDCD
MSEVGRPGPAPRMRAGTTDRQAAVDRLTTHFADGRLDAAEFDQRVAAAYASTYLDELTPLFADLPQTRPGHPSWAAPAGSFGPARPDPFSGGRGDGRWNGRRTGPPPHVRLALIVLLVFTVIWSIGAVGHGFFPFPLLWLVIVLLMVGRMRHRRWSGPGRR